RLAAPFSPSMIVKTYGGRFVIRRNSKVDPHPAAGEAASLPPRAGPPAASTSFFSPPHPQGGARGERLALVTHPTAALEWHPGPGAEELVRRRAQLHVLTDQLLGRERD